MKRIIVLTLAALVWAIGATAQAQQRHIKVYVGGTAVYDATTNGSNGLRFSNGNAIFTHNGIETTLPVADIDSMVFVKQGNSDDDTTYADTDTIAVDTATAIRITWNVSSVAIENPYSTQGVDISAVGGHVSVTSTIDMAYLTYMLGGSSNDGSLTVTSDEKVLLYMNDLSLVSTSGPTIQMASDRRMALHLEGNNSLADAAGGSHKGALQAAGKLSFQGSGLLEVTGNTKHGIQSSGRCLKQGGNIVIVNAVKDGMNIDDFLHYGGETTVEAAGSDGIDGDQGIIALYGGSVHVAAATDNGLTADGAITLGGANVDIACPNDAAKCIKTKADMVVTAGTVTLSNQGDYTIDTAADGSLDLSYATGIKVDGNLTMLGGNITHNAASTAKAVRSISCDGNIYLSGGTLNINNVSAINRFLVSGSTYQAYTSAGIKADGNITVAGNVDLNITCNGRCISTDADYTQSGGTVVLSNAGTGFTLVGSGSSCTDGFAPACLKADSSVTITGGSFSGTSTGKGGRGIVTDGRLTVGTLGAADSLVRIYVTTSGATVNTGSGSWGGSSDYWKGIAKGIKAEGDIIINSGYVQSYCSQTTGDPAGEAIESKDSIIVNGGYIEANAYDDPINAAVYYEQTGGYVWAYSRHNDAVDCNGTVMRLSGGVLIAIGTECAIDNNREASGKLYITGGTLIAIGGNMGAIESAPTCSGTQKGLTWGSSGGWGGGSGVSLATNGFCVKTTDGTEVLTFKMPTVSGSGFNDVPTMLNDSGTKPPPGGGGSGTSAVYVSGPGITSGSYRYYTSPTVSGGSHWHGLYTGATVTTSGSGTSVTAQ
jgi:hypothetical protein